jgi:cysteine-rich repeat protein
VDAGEECDDGNTLDGDGCSATCTVEPGITSPLVFLFLHCLNPSVNRPPLLPKLSPANQQMRFVRSFVPQLSRVRAAQAAEPWAGTVWDQPCNGRVCAERGRVRSVGLRLRGARWLGWRRLFQAPPQGNKRLAPCYCIDFSHLINFHSSGEVVRVDHQEPAKEGLKKLFQSVFKMIPHLGRDAQGRQNDERWKHQSSRSHLLRQQRT